MKIKKIINRNRRDFTAIYECEHCSHEETSYGYDDVNFHKNVIPSMVCSECGQKSPSEYQPIAPKYSPHEQI